MTKPEIQEALNNGNVLFNPKTCIQVLKGEDEMEPTVFNAIFSAPEDWITGALSDGAS